MKFFSKCKDGGPDSPVDGYFLVEIKGLFSIALLKFNEGHREQYHTHAFDAFTWFLSGRLYEDTFDGEDLYTYKRSLVPKLTKKDKNHRVIAIKDSWCFTIRGPWCDYWTEDDEVAQETTTFTHGRKVVKVVGYE